VHFQNLVQSVQCEREKVTISHLGFLHFGSVLFSLTFPNGSFEMHSKKFAKKAPKIRCLGHALSFGVCTLLRRRLQRKGAEGFSAQRTGARRYGVFLEVAVLGSAIAVSAEFVM
jgi:hypothetical protein